MGDSNHYIAVSNGYPFYYWCIDKAYQVPDSSCATADINAVLPQGKRLLSASLFHLLSTQHKGKSHSKTDGIFSMCRLNLSKNYSVLLMCRNAKNTPFEYDIKASSGHSVQFYTQ